MKQQALSSDISKSEADDRKVFICYAGENQELVDDFVHKFKDHFGPLELLFDGKPYSGNMHAHFRQFAEQCDIAILLVSARFANLESYASRYEMPILLKRQQNYDVTVVGVLFADVDIEAWNKAGDVYFVQTRNKDLTRTRREDENADIFNRQFAVYETIKKEDRNTYHKKLAQWVKEAVGLTAQERAAFLKTKKIRSKAKETNARELNAALDQPTKHRRLSTTKPIKTEKDNLPRSISESKKIIDKINDPFLQALEMQLSMSNDYWNDYDLTPEDKQSPLLPIFFERQRERIKVARERVEELDEEADGLLGVRLKKILPEFEKIQQDLSGLMRAAEIHDAVMERLLSIFENQLEDIRSSLHSIHRTKVKDEFRNGYLPDLFEQLDRLNVKMSELDKQMYGYTRN